jgi:hypothetical protein
MQPSVVVPVDPFQGGQLDVIERSPRAPGADEFGFEQPDVGLGQGVVQRVTDRADAGCDAGRGQPFGERDRGVLTAPPRSSAP